MKPPKKPIEKVKVDEWIKGEIKDISYDMEHNFPGYQGSEGYVGAAVKIVLSLDGYKDPKPSFWMSFNYGERSKLYNLYILPLVEGAVPKMDFDLDALKGMRIKAMYEQKPGKEYQFLSKIRPLEQKILSTSKPESDLADVEEVDEGVPF